MNVKERGQALLEILVALAIGITITTAFVTLGAFSVRNSRFASNQVSATKLATEGIEVMLGIRDQDGPVLSYPGGIKWSEIVDDSFGECALGPTDLCGGDFKLRKQDVQCLALWCLEKNPPIETIDFNNTQFSRKVRITDSETAGVKDVTVFVWWTDGNGFHKSEITRKLGREKLQ